MTLGEKIASAQKEKGMTQEMLAEQLGVTRQAVARWESADNTGCLIEHFGNADAVPQPSERCLSRKAGIMRYCLK
ncbi:MAG: helix-turn-helix transcriptional regulator [Gemmiger qucibialis]